MTDGLPLGWNLPAPATTEELLFVLDDVRACIEAGDSFEGYFAWSMPTDEQWLYPEGTAFDEYGYPVSNSDGPPEPLGEFGLLARYRVGSADGQGGMRVFEKPMAPSAQHIEQFRERSPWQLKRMLVALEEARKDVPTMDYLGTYTNNEQLRQRYKAAIEALRFALGQTETIMGIEP
jgi:hypothetical protein